MKNSILISLLGVTLCLTGCLSIDTAPVKDGGEHIMVNNYGVKFCNWIPLFCGNAADDASCGFVLFRDDVTVEKLQHRLVAAANGRMIECPSYDVKSTIFHTLFGLPIPYLFTSKEITLSGTVK